MKLKINYIRKLSVLIGLAVLISLMLPVCPVQAKEKGYKFTYKNVTVYMHGPAKKLISKSGSPIKKKTSKSCAYDGQDVTYQYKDFILYTYSKKDGGKEYVNGITFLTGSVKTKEGIGIGSSEEDMKNKYSDGDKLGDVYTFKKGKSKLQFQVKSGKVSQIRYVAS